MARVFHDVCGAHSRDLHYRLTGFAGRDRSRIPNPRNGRSPAIARETTALGLKLYNTLTRSKADFVPIDPENVRMYVCGPTVYDFAHIGNARPVIVFDVLFRLLRRLYGAEHVTYVRNITDVDDKINARAAEEYPDLPLNDAIRRVTETTTAQYHADVDALQCLRPTHEPRATEHIAGMRDIIERLVAKGFAYVAEEHVLFAPEAMNAANGVLPRYGAFSNRSLDELVAGARVDVAPYKRGPTDFVLWKPSKPGEPAWPSPAGIATPGRPGWHIECSAMSMATLLEPAGGGLRCDDPTKNMFDIHGGGIDLVFPHHENEIAQSTCAFGIPRMANVWMHNGFLQVEGEKMSKSLGNFVTISDALDHYGGAVLRLNMLKAHYRQPIDWTAASLKETGREVARWAMLVAEADKEPGGVPDGVTAALLDDLNTPQVITEMRALYSNRNAAGLSAAARLLGFSLEDADIQGRKHKQPYAEAGGLRMTGHEIEARVAARTAARAAKNWAESDRIRDELAAMGVMLKDSKDGTTWEIAR